MICIQFLEGSHKKWEVIKEIKHELSDGTTIVIPKGFQTDLSSVPQLLWNAFPPYGNFLLAALVHDYLYFYRHRSRVFSDKEMLIVSKLKNSDTFRNKIDNYIRYAAVRLFGKLYY